MNSTKSKPNGSKRKMWKNFNPATWLAALSRDHIQRPPRSV